jgi:hypothetical protein
MGRLESISSALALLRSLAAPPDAADVLAALREPLAALQRAHDAMAPADLTMAARCLRFDLLGERRKGLGLSVEPGMRPDVRGATLKTRRTAALSAAKARTAGVRGDGENGTGVVRHG